MTPKILIGFLFAFALAAADGEAVFKARCAGCHSSDGKGNPAIGTPNFTSAKTQSDISDAGSTRDEDNGPVWRPRSGRRQAG